MSKKTILIISIALVLILLLLVGYYFLQRNRSVSPTGGGFLGLFPFGTYNTPSTTPGNQSGDNKNETGTQNTGFLKKLRELSSEPVAGAGILDIKAGSIVRYIERATGHIYEIEFFFGLPIFP